MNREWTDWEGLGRKLEGPGDDGQDEGPPAVQTEVGVEVTEDVARPAVVVPPPHRRRRVALVAAETAPLRHAAVGLGRTNTTT